MSSLQLEHLKQLITKKHAYSLIALYSITDTIFQSSVKVCTNMNLFFFVLGLPKWPETDEMHNTHLESKL